MTSPHNTGTPERGGDEHDVFSKMRRMICTFKRAGATAKAKRSYNKRVRKTQIIVDDYAFYLKDNK